MVYLFLCQPIIVVFFLVKMIYHKLVCIIHIVFCTVQHFISKKCKIMSTFFLTFKALHLISCFTYQNLNFRFVINIGKFYFFSIALFYPYFTHCVFCIRCNSMPCVKKNSQILVIFLEVLKYFGSIIGVLLFAFAIFCLYCYKFDRE